MRLQKAHNLLDGESEWVRGSEMKKNLLTQNESIWLHFIDSLNHFWTYSIACISVVYMAFALNTVSIAMLSLTTNIVHEMLGYTVTLP